MSLYGPNGTPIRRGLLVEDFLVPLYNRGLTLIPFTPKLINQHGCTVKDDTVGVIEIMTKTQGIIACILESGVHHAMAWDGEKLFDPRGAIYSIEESPGAIQMTTYWALARIKSE